MKNSNIEPWDWKGISENKYNFWEFDSFEIYIFKTYSYTLKKTLGIH